MGRRKSASTIFKGQFYMHLNNSLSYTRDADIFFHEQDGYELRKQILGQLLAFKGNECEDNMPSGVKDFINSIMKTQNNMK